MTDTDRREILERKLGALFDSESVRLVKELLDTYGVEPYEREADRVRLAILKLSGNTLDGIGRYLEIAKQDYRDVIAWAEYPGQMKSGNTRGNPELQALIDEDAAQYRKWLNS